MKTIKKNAKGYNYTYTDLKRIHEYLEENNLDYYQEIETVNGEDYIITHPIVDGEKQEPIRGCRVVQATLKGNNNPAQEQGSALTYARRYSLLMAFGLATADDDAEALSDRYDELSEKPITKSHIDILMAKATEVGVEMETIIKHYGKETASDLTEADYGKALNKLKATKKK